MIQDSERKYLNTDQAAAFLGRTTGAVRNLVMRRAIPYRKAGGRLYFLKSELEAWIERAPGLPLHELRQWGE